MSIDTKEPGTPFLTPGRRRIAILLGLSAVIAAARLHTYHEPLERDITTYAVTAHEMLGGRRLYSDLWDHKPPATHLTYAAAERVTGYGPGSIYLLGVVAAVVTLFGVYAAGSAGPGGPAAGLWAAAFWTAVSGSLLLQANQPNAEVFMNACTVWALALLVRSDRSALSARRMMAIGLLFALSSLYKQVTIPCTAVLLGAHVMFPPGRPPDRRRSLRLVLWAAAIGLAAWGLVFGYFAAAGRFGAFYDAVFLYGRDYSGGIGWNLLRSLHPVKLCPRDPKLTLPLALLAGFGVVAGAWKMRRRPWALLIALGVGTQIAIALPGRFFPHYYQLWLPPLVVGAGWAVGLLGALVKRHSSWLPHATGASLLLLLVGLQVPAYLMSAEDWSRAKYGEIFVASKEFGREIDSLLEPGESFYEWGNETGLYFYSRRSPPSGVFYAYPLIGGRLAAALSERVLADLKREQPELLILNVWTEKRTSPANCVMRWFKERYRPFPRGSIRGPFLLLALRGGSLEKRLLASVGESP